MPDTVIMDTLKELFEEGECSCMNAHEFKEWLIRVEKKIDDHKDTQSGHGERIAKLEEKVTAAHRRLDEQIPQLKGPGRPWGLAIILALITAVAGIVTSFVSARHSANTETKVDENTKKIDDLKK